MQRYIHQLELRRAGHLDLPVSEKPLLSSMGAAATLREVLGDRPTEAIMVLYLDARRAPTGYEMVSVGDVACGAVRLSTVFRGALVAGAHAIILAHNHPSGDPAPSGDDDALTKRLVEAGELLALQVLDHIIIADGPKGPYYSYLDDGALR